METSAKFPANKGFWPAFWTWGASGYSGSANGETDAFEYYSDNTTNLYLTSHVGAGGSCTYAMPFNPTAGFHTYEKLLKSTSRAMQRPRSFQVLPGLWMVRRSVRLQELLQV